MSSRDQRQILTNGGQPVAVKQVRVSDLLGRQASEDEFAKLIVHQHPIPRIDYP
jgi:hypothetical protein